MFRVAFRMLFPAVLVLSAAGLVSVGCSRQAEGERCDHEWGGDFQDCDSGLKCSPCGDLEGGNVDRCCRVDGTFSVSECKPSASPTHIECSSHHANPNDGTGATGATGGVAGSGSGGTGGTGAETGGTGDAPNAGAGDAPNAGTGG